MVPKYAFQVIVTYKVGEKTNREQHNFEMLLSAVAYRDKALAKRHTSRVEIHNVIDVTTRGDLGNAE